MLKRPRPGKGSDTTFGGGAGMRSETQSPDSYATTGSPTSSASQHLAVTSAFTPPLSPRRSAPTYSPRDWQYQVAETLYLTGASSPSRSSYQDATFGSQRTSPAPSRLSRFMGRRSSLSLRPRRSDSTAPHSTSESGRTPSSDFHSPTSPMGPGPIRRLKSMPSLVEPSASDDESESSESWVDAAEEASARGEAEEAAALPTPDQPTIRLVRVRLSTDAAVIYDYERANRVSSTSTIKAPFFDRANALYFSPSPPLSPSRRFSTIERRRAETDVIEVEEREAHSDSELELDSSIDHIEIPFPPEPIRSKHIYQPTLSANFLSAPPSKLRRQFLREQSRRARTRSMPVGPTSIIGPYLHPPPARPHSSVNVSSVGREDEPSTYLDEGMRGPTTRLSPYDERMGRSLWSLSTHGAERTRPASGRTATTDGDGTTQTSGIPTSRLGLFFYTLRCIPPAAWLFVFGFLFPPFWCADLHLTMIVRSGDQQAHRWLGSFFPIVSRTGKTERWGSLRSSPLLDTASTPQPPSTPSNRTPPPVTGWRFTHEGLLPPADMPVDRLPGPKRLSDFLSEVPKFDSDEEATFWAAQKSASLFLSFASPAVKIEGSHRHLALAAQV